MIGGMHETSNADWWDAMLTWQLTPFSLWRSLALAQRALRDSRIFPQNNSDFKFWSLHLLFFARPQETRFKAYNVTFRSQAERQRSDVLPNPTLPYLPKPNPTLPNLANWPFPLISIPIKVRPTKLNLSVPNCTLRGPNTRNESVFTIPESA